MPVVFHLGALGHGEAEADEDVLELLDGLGDQVQVAGVAPAAHLGEVQALGLGLRPPGGGREGLARAPTDRFEGGVGPR